MVKYYHSIVLIALTLMFLVGIVSYVQASEAAIGLVTATVSTSWGAFLLAGHALCSMLSNLISVRTVVGKAIHWGALNIRVKP